jgi:hypothetical protein
LCVAQMYFLRKAFLCSKKFRRLSWDFSLELSDIR